jgi:hypothetical protein
VIFLASIERCLLDSLCSVHDYPAYPDRHSKGDPEIAVLQVVPGGIRLQIWHGASPGTEKTYLCHRDILLSMRTTVRLDEDLLRQAKRLAAEKGTTLTALIDQGLREILSRGDKAPAHKRVSLPTFKGRGLQPRVDLDDTSALLDLMEEDDSP